MPLSMQTAEAEDARADVGHVQRLEVALDDAVLAEGAVQDREHHRVGREQLRRGGATAAPCAVVEQVVGGGQGVELVDVVEHGPGVDPPLVVGQPDQR